MDEESYPLAHFLYFMRTSHLQDALENFYQVLRIYNIFYI